MADLAAEHLTDLQHQLHNARFQRDLRSRNTVPELARLTHVLARYHDQIANGFGVPNPAARGVRDAAHHAGALIKQAEHVLGPPAKTETPRSAVAQKLRAASIALGCGLDLLSTHLPTGPDGEPAVNAVVMATPETGRSLLDQLSVHTATVGHLARRTSPPTDQAGALLLKAAIVARINSQKKKPPITALPIHHTPNRVPPQAGENNHQALIGIDTSVQRLSNPTTPTAITTWRYLARAAAIICDLNTKTVRQLIYRINELNEPHHLNTLNQAATDLKYVSASWKSIVRQWDEYIGHHGHPANGPATDASDLIIRLGRLLHADPAWTPGPRASSRLKPPQDLAPDLAHAAQLATVTLKTIEACNNIAAHHHAAINDAAAIGVINRQKKYPTHLPRIPKAVRDLSTRYDTAQTRGHQAIATLGQSIQALTHPSASTPHEVQLITYRAAIISEQIQPKLAATEFPGPITDHLDSQEQMAATNPRRHRPTHPNKSFSRHSDR